MSGGAEFGVHVCLAPKAMLMSTTMSHPIPEEQGYSGGYSRELKLSGISQES